MIKTHNDYVITETAVLIMFSANIIGDIVKNKIVFYEKDIEIALNSIDNYIGCGDSNKQL